MEQSSDSLRVRKWKQLVARNRTDSQWLGPIRKPVLIYKALRCSSKIARVAFSSNRPISSSSKADRFFPSASSSRESSSAVRKAAETKRSKNNYNRTQELRFQPHDGMTFRRGSFKESMVSIRAPSYGSAILYTKLHVPTRNASGRAAALFTKTVLSSYHPIFHATSAEISVCT